MRKRSILTGLFLIILLSITIIVRIYYVSYMMSEVNIDEDIYNAAKVSVGSGGPAAAFCGRFSDKVAVHMQSVFRVLAFWKLYSGRVYLNILYQLLTVFLVYIVIKSVTNRYVGFAGSLILAILPTYINTLSKVTMLNMLICIAVLVSTVVILMIQWIYHRRTAKKCS